MKILLRIDQNAPAVWRGMVEFGRYSSLISVVLADADVAALARTGASNSDAATDAATDAEGEGARAAIVMTCGVGVGDVAPCPTVTTMTIGVAGTVVAAIDTVDVVDAAMDEDEDVELAVTTVFSALRAFRALESLPISKLLDRLTRQ